MKMENHDNPTSLTYKVIQLQDKFINHSDDQPYIQTSHKDKLVLFTLRTIKTYKYEPILLIDCYEQEQLHLPLPIGGKIDQFKNYLILRGQFGLDGLWYCKHQFKQPGVFHFQLVFVEYGSTQIRDVGSFDCLLLVQNKIELRKLRKQTVFPRCIGNIRFWDSFLKKQVALGYNSFHFAPIQQTGQSKSYYSIYDQLELSSDVFVGDSNMRYQQLEALLAKYQQKGIIFFIDIVLNHTSFDSEWIKENQNTVFTVENTPILRSAYQLDLALKNWGEELKNRKSRQKVVEMDQKQFQSVKSQLQQLICSLQLYQFFQIGQSVIQQFISLAEQNVDECNQNNSQLVLGFLQQNCDGFGENRKGVTIYNLKEKWSAVCYRCGANDIKVGLEKFNENWENIIKKQWERQIINNLLGQIKYFYFEAKIKKYDDNQPFIHSYFGDVTFKNGRTLAALKSGWVMTTNSEDSIITSKNCYYFRRMISEWGDLIRIRYGKNEEDSYSWQHIKKYIKMMLKYFDGFRLDNFHGTEIRVAQKLIKYARKLKPQIIIFAQLFTKIEKQKNKYIRLSGLNSILSELKHHQSGDKFLHLFYEKISKKNEYAGSVNPYFDGFDGHKIKYCRRKKPVLLLYDLTHDNKTYEEKRNAIKKISIVLLAQFCGTFIGSTKGFDQFYTHKISVIETQAIYQLDEDKPAKSVQLTKWNKKFIYASNNANDNMEIYGSWDSWSQGKKMHMNGKIGYEINLELNGANYEYKYQKNGQWITDPNKYVNENYNHSITLGDSQKKTIYANLQYLRKKCSVFREKYFSYNEYYLYCQGDIVILIRQKKILRESVCIIANLSNHAQKFTKPVLLPGKIERVDIWVQSGEGVVKGHIMEVSIVNSFQINQYFDVYFNEHEQKDVLLANDLPPGFGCIIQCRKTKEVERALKNIQGKNLDQLNLPPLGPLDYNLIMYGVEQEQQMRFNSTNFYLPSQKRKLIFGGFGGVVSELEKAKKYNILSNGLFDSVREGNWLVDYYIGRLKRFRYLDSFAEITERYFESLKNVPPYLRPKFFTNFIYSIYVKLQKSMSDLTKSRFHQQLLLAATQFISSFKTQNPQFIITLSVGLPNFSVGSLRCWGRWTFASSQLLLAHPDIYYLAILQFASVFRYGTIPNILDYGVNPRYNGRDVCWWFIRGVKQYARETKDYQIFRTKVNLVFLSDDEDEHKQMVGKKESKILVVGDIIQKIFQAHIDGISYRQQNVGYENDYHVSNQGLNIELKVDGNTGFIVGGNDKNGLTWMDKIGSSDKAKNKGMPASSRAGAPIELTALLYHCLVQYSKLNEQGYYPYSGVKCGQIDMSFKCWAQKISKNFENYYWLSQKRNAVIKYENIYKDVVLSPPSLATEATMLRPNALIALAIAPQLLCNDHALQYLDAVQKQLIFSNSIGISTLGHAHEQQYVAYYDTTNDSTNYKIAKGFSQHNGSQWVWLYGFYIKAKCNFVKCLKQQQLYSLLQNHIKYIQNNNWGSLPELTNRNGQTNQQCCQTSICAISSMLLALKAIQNYDY